MTIQEKIRILLVRRGNMSEAELARRLGMFPQNLHRKMKTGKFDDYDISNIADILGCTVIIPPPPPPPPPIFTFNDTGEQV